MAIVIQAHQLPRSQLFEFPLDDAEDKLDRVVIWLVGDIVDIPEA